MASIPDLISLLCLDPSYSLSPFGGQHRTVLILRDFTNSGDFVFNNLLQHFGRKEPDTPTILVTLAHDWTNYSASAAKCGINLRRCQNGGNVEVLNVMSKILDSVKCGAEDLNPCNYIEEEVTKFIEKHTPVNHGESFMKPIIVMIDDISVLSTIGSRPNEVYRLFTLIDKLLRARSQRIQSNQMSHFIAQTMITNPTSKQVYHRPDGDLNYMVTNMENSCDLVLSIKPLETGYSLKVDGTIKIVDNRLPSLNRGVKANHEHQSPATSTYLFPDSHKDIGLNKAFFFKLGDRRVRLTSSALVF